MCALGRLIQRCSRRAAREKWRTVRAHVARLAAERSALGRPSCAEGRGRS
jgi:hypothetical protein